MANGGPTDAPAPDALHAAALPRGDVRVEIEAAAQRTAERPDFPTDYVDRVNAQTARFALRTAAPDDIRAALAVLEEQTEVQPLAPVASRNRGVTEAKRVVRKAVFFTTNHTTEQLRALGWATASVGSAAADRIEQLEARVRDLEERLRRFESSSE